MNSRKSRDVVKSAVNQVFGSGPKCECGRPRVHIGMCWAKHRRAKEAKEAAINASAARRETVYQAEDIREKVPSHATNAQVVEALKLKLFVLDEARATVRASLRLFGGDQGDSGQGDGA